MSDLGGFAVSLGPGGFTSLRVGLATAQGLAIAAGKPLVGCSTFEALVAMAAGWQGSVCPVLEARRGEVYAAFYDRQEATVREVMPGMVTTPDALCTLVTERTIFLGSGVRVYRTLLTATLGAHAVCLENIVEGELAASVARLGQTRLPHASTAARQALTPLYMRAADARLPRYPVAGAAPSLSLGITESGG
jgi:tRNA threonylcarbamoyladenosine biosynthesis protein TsaB